MAGVPARGAVLGLAAALLFTACAGPRYGGPLYERGLDFERRGRLDEAVAALRQAADRDRGDPVPREALASLFYRRGWLASATQAWETALADSSGVKGGAPDSAAEEARRRAAAGLLKIYLARGAASVRGALWADASADYLRATELDSGNAEAWCGLALAAGRLKDKDTAYLAYRRAFELVPGNADLAWGYGYEAHAVSRFGDALEAYRRYTSLEPLDARGWNNEGTILVELGRFAESQACFDRALALRPALIPALNGKGSAFYYAARFEDARSQWARVLDLDPGDPTATRNMSTLVKMGF
ncbi:MAG TPA: tetratricopeptide repeat protein [bacterium]|jgi:tetratricopeptide (TPR) repeat protein|nr:tetratricopeptide repeat protein [bacterium]